LCGHLASRERTSNHFGPFSVIVIRVSFSCFAAGFTDSGFNLEALTKRSLCGAILELCSSAEKKT